MSSIYRKVKAVERIFKQVSEDIEQFQQHSKLYCLSGCGQCCLKPDIEATALEFLPFAYYVYKQGLAFSWLEKLQENQSGSVCSMLRPFLEHNERGFCSHYTYRGLICRLFGFSATRNKYGAPVLATCRPIKLDQQENVEQAQKAITAGAFVPMGRNYYMQLSAIDFTLGNEFYPINQAIARAIETVLNYYCYREKSKLKKAS